MIARKPLAVAGLISLGLMSFGLGACSSGMSRYVQDAPGDPGSDSAYYLDSTAPSMERTGSTRKVARRAPAPQASVRSDDISGTTGSRMPVTARDETAPKPYSQEWWDKENREDARLKQKMNICRGC